MSEPRVGQVWADNDPRHKGRQIEIVGVHDADATHAEPYVKVRVVKVGRNVRKKEVGEQRTILQRRLRPTRNGYKLVEEGNPVPSSLLDQIEDNRQHPERRVPRTEYPREEQDYVLRAQVQCYHDGSRDGHLHRPDSGCPPNPTSQARAY